MAAWTNVWRRRVHVLLKHGREKYGRGMISVSCSHRLSEFCDRRRTESGQRSITLTYVPEGEPVLALQRDCLGEHQPQHDADGPGLLETACAHACFKHVASDSITLDWEGRQDDALQWLCRNAIGPQFYYDTTVLWQKKWESKDSSPWPNGVLSPPLAWGIGLTEAPPGHVVKKTPGGGVEMKYDPQMRAAIEARARARRSQEEEERKVEELFEQTVTVT